MFEFDGMTKAIAVSLYELMTCLKVIISLKYCSCHMKIINNPVKKHKHSQSHNLSQVILSLFNLI